MSEGNYIDCITAEIDFDTFEKFKNTFNVQGPVYNGYSFTWDGVKFYCTDNMPVIENSNEDTNNPIHYIIFRTKEAITFAEKALKIEPYRPEKNFYDAVKFQGVYGAKVTCPSQLVVVKCKLGDEKV